MDERDWDELSDAEREEVIAEVCWEIRDTQYVFMSERFWHALREIAADYSERHPEIF